MMSEGWSLFAQRRPEKEPPKYSPNRPNPSRQRHPGLNAATQARQSHVNCFDERFTPKWPLSGLRHLDPARQSSPIASREPALSSDEHARTVVCEATVSSLLSQLTG